MATKSKIEWTEVTWNPVRGCTFCSPGCLHCYAARIVARFSGEGVLFQGLACMTPDGPRWTNEVVCLEDKLMDPLRWKKPRKIFVNSMSDLFHEKVPFDFLHRLFEVMQGADWHSFQVLTKRSQRLAHLSPHLPWADNIWMGVSIENEQYLHRADDLRGTGARVKFLSLEPLLGPLRGLNLTGIDWVIVGGESGPGARPMSPEWVVEVRDKCQRAGVPFFLKQWGKITNNPDPTDPTATGNDGNANGGRMLEGRTWDQMPASVHQQVVDP